MNTQQMIEEIKELNLSYLMLAQQMIRSDKATALFRLGVCADTADLISGLTPAQILRMASSGVLLCQFRLDESVLINMLTGYSKDRMMTQAHASIMLSAQPVAELVA
jgi:flagellar transcriptional activator FlhD